MYDRRTEQSPIPANLHLQNEKEIAVLEQVQCRDAWSQAMASSNQHDLLDQFRSLFF